MATRVALIWKNNRLQQLAAPDSLGYGGVGVYGDGSDGTATISGTTTLSRDMFYSALTVAGAGVLQTAGYRVYIKTICVVATGGIISNNGSYGFSAAGAPTGSISGGGNGGGLALAGTAMTDSLGGAGGAASAGGGAGGTATAPAASRGGARSLIALLSGHLLGGGAVTAVKGGAGGGGGDQGGGGGGGVVVLAARHLDVQGQIQANGGDGGDAISAGVGGGGGGGGTIFLVYGDRTNPDTPIAGSKAFVSGGLGGFNVARNTRVGSSGAAGTIFELSH